MKIATIQYENYEKLHGGSYIKLLDMMNSLLANNHKIYYFSPKDFKNIKHKNFYHIPLNFNSNPKIFFYYFNAIKEIYNRNIDVIITFDALDGIIGIIVKLIKRDIKIIIYMHADSYEGMILAKINPIKIMMYLLIEKISIKFSNKVIFVSKYNKNTLLQRIHETKRKNVYVLYNNINEEMIKKSFEEIILIDNYFKIGFIGNLYWEGKGIKYLLEAITAILLENNNVRLYIIGIGPDEKLILKYIKEKNIKNNVILTGFVNNPLKYMKKFDLIVLPSLHEASSLVILEAFQSNTPIIASNVGGITEILYFDELMFKPKSSDAIKLKIQEIILSKQYYDKIKNLCQERKKKFMFDWGSELNYIIEK
jgi:glycosyltransferase involved in cell wall biosynthesis